MDNLYKVLTAGGSIPPNHIKVIKEKPKMSKLGKESPAVNMLRNKSRRGKSYPNISSKNDELEHIDLIKLQKSENRKKRKSKPKHIIS